MGIYTLRHRLGSTAPLWHRWTDHPGYCAQAGDNIHQINLDTATQNSLLIGGGLVAGVWVMQLAGSLLLIVIPMLVYGVGGRKTADWVKRQSEMPWRKPLYLGVLSSIILLAVSLLCIVTIIGIPLLLLVALIVVAAVVLGIAPLSYQLGGFLQEKWIPNAWVRLVIGASIVAAIANIPIIGWLAALFLFVFSLNTFTQWLFSFRRKKMGENR